MNLFVFGILFLFLITNVSAYTRTTTNGATYSGIGGFGSFSNSISASDFDSELCSAGTDFILQLQPFDCTPAPVRSDLLEDGDVAVYCKIGATQINPLIDVESISRIDINGEYPREVKSFGYLPAQAALGYSDLDNALNNPLLNNLGYVMIILRQNSNESSMPDYVVGNLSAKITYDVENAFGVGSAEFYLPVLTDDEFYNRIDQYSFWEGRGFLRAESVDDEQATISIYSGTSVSTSYSSSEGRTYAQNKFSQRIISEGESSGEIYLPGFSPCLASFELRLNSVEEADTRAGLMINSDYYEISKGSSFLDEKCEVRTLEKDGLNQKVGIKCKEDEGTTNFNLIISPGVKLYFDGESKDYSVGDFLYQESAGDKKSVYLGYVGSKSDTGELEDLFVVLVALPEYNPQGLSDDDISSISKRMDQVYSGIKKDSSPVEILSQSFSSLFGNSIRFVKWIVTGQDTQAITFTDVSVSPETTFKGKGVSLRGYSDGEENNLVEVYEESYTLEKSTLNFFEIYKILKDGEDTGLYLSYGSAIDSPKIYLYTTVLGAGALKLAVFEGKDCKVQSECSEYYLSQVGLNEVETDAEFFDDVISGKVLVKENKIVTKKINFDSGAGEDYKEYYENAISDFETIINSYSTQIDDASSSETYGERALYEAILLSEKVGQMKTVNELCTEFKESYPDSDKPLKICNDDYKLSNTGVSSREIFVNGKNKLISFEGIYEPSYTEYGAEVTVRGPNGKTQIYELKKGKTVYLDALRTDADAVEEDIYVRTEPDANQIVSYKFSEAKWYWSFDEITWFDSSKTKADSGAYNGVDLSSINLKIVSQLKESNKVSGINLLEFEGAILKKVSAESATETSSEYMQLISVDENSAKIEIRVNGRSIFSKLSDTYTFNIDDSENYGSEYMFTLTDTNIEKVARVSVIPSFNYKESNSTFSFKIGIEKRAIQLSDDQIQTRIDSLNNSINDLTVISDKLNSFNKALGTTCLATGTYFTIKNFIANSDGKAIARQKVMRENGGWNEFCAGEVSKGVYVSLDDCFLENADAIDAQVEEMNTVMQQQDVKIKEIEDSPTVTKEGLFSNTVVNQDEFMKEYSVEGSGSLNNLPASVLDSTGKVKDPNKRGDSIDLTNMKTLLDYTSWKEGNTYNYEDLRDIELYAELVKKNSSNEFYKERLYSLLTDVQINAESFAVQRSFSEDSGLESSAIMDLGGKKSVEIPVEKYETFGESEYSGYGFGKDPAVSQSVYVYAIKDSITSDEYLIVYGDDGNVINTYKIWAKELELYREKDVVDKNPFNLRFKKYDASSYENEYKNAEIKYYEEEPYKGYPAVVPLDTKNGWYAATKPTLGTGKSISAYDESGRLNSFWLCNVGDNSLEEFQSSGFGDDICEQINLGTGQPYNQFYSLGESETTKLVNQAIDAIERAQRAYRDGVNKVSINGVSYKVGEPAVSVPAVQCQDYMSPKECRILFNVCDPVVCPSSRCDLGGNYPVQDVVQSGIIGSIALCFPNYKEGIYIPVCTTGVQAGIDSWISVQKSYRDCLQENLETGATIGICDEIHSVYACEFFWKQALPLTKVALPKILSAIAGENTRGGGEYLGVQSAWENAQDSLSYFKQSYAAEAFNAFKLRSVDEAGGTVCKNFASIVYPSGGDFVDSLVTPRSPSQFTGNFDEISLTTATNPPTSHYKVYYHIYAGEDSGVYYQVYLQGGSSSSYYQDTAANRVVASGYVALGDYQSETVDITAPSGYSTMCIVVNGQEECGFGKVSTSFAGNYLNDLYLEEQSTTKVTKESDCVSGTASLYSFLNPNGESVLNDLIDPALYSKGIIRICATNSPGAGTDEKDGTEDARWRDVGYCDNTDVRCWIDTESVKNAIKSMDVENKALDETAKSLLDSLADSGAYLSEEAYSGKISEIESEGDNLAKIELINTVIEKVFFSNQKAELFLLRGLAYGDLAEDNFKKLERVKSEVATNDLEDAYDDVITSCDIVKVPTDILTISDARERVLERAKQLEGTIVPGGSSINCFTAADYVYDSAGVGMSNCVYSDFLGKYYVVDGQRVNMGVDKNSRGDILFQIVNSPDTTCSLNKLDSSVTEDEKLDNLKEGDLLSIVYSSASGHNVIFIEWIDKSKRNAKVFDWNGKRLEEGDKVNGVTCTSENFKAGQDYCKVYQYTEVDLSDDKHPVYRIWNPVISGQTSETPTTNSGEIDKIDSLTSNNPVYEISFRDSGFAQMNYKDLDLVFASNVWYWKLTQSSTTSTNYFALYSSSSSNWIESNLDVISKDYAKSDVYNNLDTQSKRFVRDLYGLSYAQGLQELMDFAVSEGTVLKTEKVYYPKSSSERYFVYKRNNGDQIYFRYIVEDKIWLVEPLSLDRDVYWIKVNDFSAEKEGSNYVIREGLSVKYRGSIEDFNSFNNLIEGLKNKDYENGIIYLFGQNSEFGKIILYSSEKNSLGNLDSAITYVKGKINNDGISDLSVLVRELRDSGILTSEETNFILGGGKNNLQNFPEDADYLLNFLMLKKGLSTFCTDVKSPECYIDYVDKNFGKTERYTTFLENRIFIDYVYINGFISTDQYNLMLPSTAGQMLYNLGRALGGTPEKGKTMGELKTLLEQNTIVSLCGYSVSYNENADFLNFLSDNNLDMSDINCDFVYIENNHIVQFYIDGKKLTNLDNLANLIYLRDLRLTNAGINDASVLGNLVNLQALYLNGNNLANANFLDNLKVLTSLNLANNNLRDLNFILERDYLNAIITLDTLDISQNCIPKDADYATVQKYYAKDFSYIFNPRQTGC